MSEEKVPTKIDIGESLKVKQALDEALVKAVTDMGFEEDFKWSNVKLILMAVACLFALTAQFYPKPFPESRTLLAVCCISYFLCSSILQVVISCFEQDVIVVTRPKNDSAIRIRTVFPRFQDVYTFKIEVLEGKDSLKATCLPFKLLPLIDAFAPFSFSSKQSRLKGIDFKVGSYFDSEGYFDEEGACIDFTKAIRKSTKKNKL